jgi:hypothetical protein
MAFVLTRAVAASVVGVGAGLASSTAGQLLVGGAAVAGSLVATYETGGHSWSDGAINGGAAIIARVLAFDVVWLGIAALVGIGAVVVIEAAGSGAG